MAEYTKDGQLYIERPKLWGEDDRVAILGPGCRDHESNFCLFLINTKSFCEDVGSPCWAAGKCKFNGGDGKRRMRTRRGVRGNYGELMQEVVRVFFEVLAVGELEMRGYG